MDHLRKKAALLRGTVILAFFLVTALTVYFIRSNIAYLFMFSGIGLIAGFTEFQIALTPVSGQKIRKTSLAILAGSLVLLALVIGINFQFSQIFIDLYSGIVTGAAIQFIAARLLLPWFFGNIFCSRACWDAAAFEYLEAKKSNFPSLKEHTRHRSISAWIYLVLIAAAASFYGMSNSLLPGSAGIRWTFVIINVLIIIISILGYPRKGSRAYCRKLCPFITISGVFSQFSLFKVDPVKHQACTACGKCTRACPMHINVMEYVQQEKRIDHPDCTMCEECISVCPEECMMVKLKS